MRKWFNLDFVETKKLCDVQSPSLVCWENSRGYLECASWLYGRIEWQGPLKILRNTLDVGYNDEFDMVWYVKGLIASKTNVVVTWRDRPKMGSFTLSPAGPCFGVFPMVVLCCMVFVCNWVCSMCIKKKEKVIVHWKHVLFGYLFQSDTHVWLVCG